MIKSVETSVSVVENRRLELWRKFEQLSRIRMFFHFFRMFTIEWEDTVLNKRVNECVERKGGEERARDQV